MPRYDAPEPFSGSYVEYSDAWSVGQRNRFFTVKGADFVALIATKIKALHLPCAEGDDITDPEELTFEALDRLDDRILRWFLDTASDCLRRIAEMGEALRLPPSATTEATGAESPNPSMTPGS